MKIRCRFLNAALCSAVVFLALTAQSIAANSGMFLCGSPLIAQNFWNDLLTAQTTGVHINRQIMENVADSHKCKFLASDNLKPIDFVWGQLAITDGHTKGWADPHLYIFYVNRNENESLVRKQFSQGGD